MGSSVPTWTRYEKSRAERFTAKWLPDIAGPAIPDLKFRWRGAHNPGALKKMRRMPVMRQVPAVNLLMQ